MGEPRLALTGDGAALRLNLPVHPRLPKRAPIPAQTMSHEKGYWKYLALVGEVGLVLVACIGGGLLAGIILDGWLRTSPALTLVLLFAGIAAGFFHVFRLLLPKGKR